MIGLIFGDTDFPKEILKTVKKRKIKYLIIDLSKSKKLHQEKDLAVFSVVVGLPSRLDVRHRAENPKGRMAQRNQIVT